MQGKFEKFRRIGNLRKTDETFVQKKNEKILKFIKIDFRKNLNFFKFKFPIFTISNDPLKHPCLLFTHHANKILIFLSIKLLMNFHRKIIKISSKKRNNNNNLNHLWSF